MTLLSLHNPTPNFSPKLHATCVKFKLSVYPNFLTKKNLEFLLFFFFAATQEINNSRLRKVALLFRKKSFPETRLPLHDFYFIALNNFISFSFRKSFFLLDFDFGFMSRFCFSGGLSEHFTDGNI